MDRAVAADIASDACAVAPRQDALVRIGARSAIYIASFAIIAAYFLIWPVWRAQFPLEIWPTEGWNAYLQDASYYNRQSTQYANDTSILR